MSDAAAPRPPARRRGPGDRPHAARPTSTWSGVAASVAASLEAVRARGDDALVERRRAASTCADFTHDRLRVPPASRLERRGRRASTEDLRTAIVAAASQVRVVAEALLPDDRHVTLPVRPERIRVRRVPGRLRPAATCPAAARRVPVQPRSWASCRRRSPACARIAVGQPAGAGRPPGARRSWPPPALLGVDEVYAAGGAAAIGALAYGTATIAPVAVIVRPREPLGAGGEAPGGRHRWASTASPAPAR